eukprot:2904804-Amphidinium_carterae.1
MMKVVTAPSPQAAWDRQALMCACSFTTISQELCRSQRSDLAVKAEQVAWPLWLISCAILMPS